MSPDTFNESPPPPCGQERHRRSRLISDTAAGAPTGLGGVACAGPSHASSAQVSRARGY
jgi:hypothetical protein